MVIAIKLKPKNEPRVNKINFIKVKLKSFVLRFKNHEILRFIQI